MKKEKRKDLDLAIQGGGAHGAFTWGVLDKLLESKLFNIKGISATSAGSMNAVVFAQGMIEGGEEKARDLLYDFWHAMSDYGKMFDVTKPTPWDELLKPYLKVPLSYYFFSSMTNLFSPYQFNPHNFHPIKEVLKKIINIESIRNQNNIALFICATNIKTGKIRIFNKDELTIESMLASACLPKLFQAVQIDNEYYWDGGYLGNPAIFPLIYYTDTKDIVILHSVPIERDEVPTTVAEIDSRLREISFNSSLMREMRAIAFVSRLVEEGWLKKEYHNKLKKLNIHCVREDENLKKFSLATVFSPDWNFLVNLRDMGRRSAEVWLEKNYDSIGKKTSIDFNEWL